MKYIPAGILLIGVGRVAESSLCASMVLAGMAGVLSCAVLGNEMKSPSLE